MCDNKIQSEILQKMASLETKVDGINNRLDALNGRVAKNADKIVSLEKEDVNLLSSMNKVLEYTHDIKIELQSKKVKIVRDFGLLVVGIGLAFFMLFLARLGVLDLFL